MMDFKNLTIDELHNIASAQVSFWQRKAREAQERGIDKLADVATDKAQDWLAFLIELTEALERRRK